METANINVYDVRKYFPAVNQNKLLFFDNSATTQKPTQVIDAVLGYYLDGCANAGRGHHFRIRQVDAKLSETRRQLCQHFNSEEASSFFFTNGATSSFQWLIRHALEVNLQTGDEIMVCLEDHKSVVSEVLELQARLEQKNVFIKVVPILMREYGDYDTKQLLSSITNQTKFLILSHVHHLYGMDCRLDKIVPYLKQYPGVQVIVDESQSVSHKPIDLKQYPVDYLFFSGHKMFSDTGIGVLYIKEKHHGIFKEPPISLIEKGSLHVSGIYSLSAALSFLSNIKLDHAESYLCQLTQYFISCMKQISEVTFIKGPAYSGCAVGDGIVTFTIANYPAFELGELFGEYGILLRSNNNCMVTSKENNYLRISLQIYNTEAEIDRFVSVLKTILVS